MSKARVILFVTLAACGYGVIHDQITIRLCTEYFTIAHPPLFRVDSPTLLALCWGIASTVAIGAGFGVVLALVSQGGDSPPHRLSRLVPPVLRLLGVMAASAFVSAVAGYQLSTGGMFSLPSHLAAAIPVHQHHRFMAAWFAHGASYLVGLVGGTLICYRVWRQRGSPIVIAFLPRTRGALIRTVIIVAVVVFILWARFFAK